MRKPLPVLLSAIENTSKIKPESSGIGSEKIRAMAVEAAKLAQQKVAGGHFGTVYETGPGTVTKEIRSEKKKQKLLNEINMQARAAELGIAPKIESASLMPVRIEDKIIPLNQELNPNMRGEITMQDLRDNYVILGVNTGDPYAHYRSLDFTGAPFPGMVIETNPELSINQIKKAKLDTHKQVAQLALNNISLHDRHFQNIFVNKMTGRPMQIDFGIATEIKNNREKASNISLQVSQGLHMAGLKEEALIFKGIMDELLSSDPDAALDVAKQGLSRLQKIKQPINPKTYSYATVPGPEYFISPLGD